MDRVHFYQAFFTFIYMFICTKRKVDLFIAHVFLSLLSPRPAPAPSRSEPTCTKKIDF